MKLWLVKDFCTANHHYFDSLLALICQFSINILNIGIIRTADVDVHCRWLQKESMCQWFVVLDSTLRAHLLL